MGRGPPNRHDGRHDDVTGDERGEGTETGGPYFGEGVEKTSTVPRTTDIIFFHADVQREVERGTSTVTETCVPPTLGRLKFVYVPFRLALIATSTSAVSYRTRTVLTPGHGHIPATKEETGVDCTRCTQTTSTSAHGSGTIVDDGCGTPGGRAG